MMFSAYNTKKINKKLDKIDRQMKKLENTNYFEQHFLIQLFTFPGPKDLGKADRNSALPLRPFCQPDDYTWDDHEKTLKQMFPVKYFLLRTLVELFKHHIYYKIYRFFNHCWDLFRYHTYHKYHILDLRQKRSDISATDEYRYGFIDVDQQMIFALFNLLSIFVEQDLAHVEVKPHEDVILLYNWWHTDRKLHGKKISYLSDQLLNARMANDKIATKMISKLYKDELQKFEDQEDEMLFKLIKIRKTLWI